LCIILLLSENFAICQKILPYTITLLKNVKKQFGKIFIL